MSRDVPAAEVAALPAGGDSRAIGAALPFPVTAGILLGVRAARKAVSFHPIDAPRHA